MWYNFLYLLGLVVWLGTIIFFSFVGAPTLFKVLPREEAGKAVGAIFSKYYPVGYIAGFVSLAMLIVSWVQNGHWPIFKLLLLVIMLGFSLFTSLVTHPKARAFKEEMMSSTEESEIHHLKTEFDHLHKNAVVNNAIVLILGLILLLLTARGLNL